MDADFQSPGLSAFSFLTFDRALFRLAPKPLPGWLESWVINVIIPTLVSATKRLVFFYLPEKRIVSPDHTISSEESPPPDKRDLSPLFEPTETPANTFAKYKFKTNYYLLLAFSLSRM